MHQCNTSDTDIIFLPEQSQSHSHCLKTVIPLDDGVFFFVVITQMIITAACLHDGVFFFVVITQMIITAVCRASESIWSGVIYDRDTRTAEAVVYLSLLWMPVGLISVRTFCIFCCSELSKYD